tara:strand:+ start:201 stop:845 length:645 start_codon:yes stop_codon:yes gene_type:complete
VNNFFSKELLRRIISVLIYVPIVIIPLIYSNYISIFIYLIFTAMILVEINNMKRKVNKRHYYNIYISIVIASFFLFLFLLITETKPLLIIFIILTIWLFDTFSYLGGKIIGGKKLMPKISSGKTVSGLISGVLMTLITTNLFFYFTEYSFKLSNFIIINILIMSFLGDSLVSLLKRYASIKDSGNIMPGHGGLLDRFDSFIMVFFIIGLTSAIR